MCKPNNDRDNKILPHLKTYQWQQYQAFFRRRRQHHLVLFPRPLAQRHLLALQSHHRYEQQLIDRHA